jgi:hypothetical protein
LTTVNPNSTHSPFTGIGWQDQPAACGHKELNPKTLPRIRQQLLPSDNHALVYYQNYYAMFSPFELIGFVVML